MPIIHQDHNWQVTPYLLPRGGPIVRERARLEWTIERNVRGTTSMLRLSAVYSDRAAAEEMADALNAGRMEHIRKLGLRITSHTYEPY